METVLDGVQPVQTALVVPLKGRCATIKIDTTIPSIQSPNLFSTLKPALRAIIAKIPASRWTPIRNMAPSEQTLTTNRRSPIALFLARKTNLETAMALSRLTKWSSERFGKPITKLTLKSTYTLSIRWRIKSTPVTTTPNVLTGGLTVPTI